MKNDVKGVAIVGMACKYPDANNYHELWENILQQRRAFRKMPENRLSSDYFSTNDYDKIYAQIAAVIEGYEFDRLKYGISGKNFRGTDLTHWLALDVATLALEDAGLIGSKALPNEKTGVYVGNTLTGEFSRANTLRLRWPFVKKKILQQLSAENWPGIDVDRFLNELEAGYKSAFPAMFEDSLAGGLANTIAGRICNYYNFNGGGYTVDGACSSSLLAVIDACKQIISGDNLICLAGGVDLSLDPFELVGFSRSGALARNEMLVYDKQSNGFWPGEGCGFVVLADMDYAREQNLNILAVIKGWGISSDGQGGLTRPAVSGQSLALERAYNRAGYPIQEVDYFEGHGTGTEVGDAVELQALISNLSAGSNHKKHYIGSVKANIGHTKAAAGIAGLIKIVNVVKNKILPPVTACKNQHELLLGDILNVTDQTVALNQPGPVRAGVSAMGFGGINTHLTIESGITATQGAFNTKQAGNWDCMPFLFCGDSKHDVVAQLKQVAAYAEALSMAEMTDLSAALHKKLQNGQYRAAVIASSALDLKAKLKRLLKDVDTRDIVYGKDIFYYGGQIKSKIGYLFPGQGSKSFSSTGGFLRMFPDLYLPAGYPNSTENSHDLSITQPAIVGTALMAASLLKKFGIDAVIGVGHSLGEIAALGWCGALTTHAAMNLALQRGEVMMQTAGIGGRMLIVSAGKEQVLAMIADREIEIAGINAAKQTVVAGKENPIQSFITYLTDAGIAHVLLPVKYAFHSSAMQLVQDGFGKVIEKLEVHEPQKRIISTVTGNAETEVASLKSNLLQQLQQPVLFQKAIEKADAAADCWIELGGDRTLQNIVKHISNKPIVSVALDGISSNGVFNALALAWVMGNQVKFNLLFDTLFTRDFDLAWNPSFFTNPCEDILETDNSSEIGFDDDVSTDTPDEGLMYSFKMLIAKRLELPVSELQSKHRFLDDLHLNSLEVGRLIAEFASQQDVKIRGISTEYANASLQEVVDMLESSTNTSPIAEVPAGTETWVHYFELNNLNQPLNRSRSLQPVAPVSDWHLIPGEGGLTYQQNEISGLNGTGVIADLKGCDEQQIISIMAALAQYVPRLQKNEHVVVLQDKQPVSGFIKSLYAENQHIHFLVLTADEKLSIQDLNHELAASSGFTESVYNKGSRSVPVLRPVFNLPSNGPVQFSANDVIIITGGAKGITAECALALGMHSEARLALLGRANPATDVNLRNNLERFEQQGIIYRYYAVDITQQEQLLPVMKSIQNELGPVTGFIHGAGINRPVAASALSAALINETCNAKLLGFRNVLRHINPGQLKLLIGFGSIIAESGMNGNADYALANAWLRQDILQFAAGNPSCKCLNAEWSVWSGAGMGESLGVLENLMSTGIQPVSMEKGIELFISWMKNFPASQNIIISGRYGNIGTIKHPAESLPVCRFIDEVKLYYPGVELIAEFELSEHTDLYLKDHTVSGEMVFPAVMGLEAMEQAAFTLHRQCENFTVSHAKFSYPISRMGGQTQRVRIIATRIADDVVKVVLRCASSAYCMDHFEATLTAVHTKEAINGYFSDTWNKPDINVTTAIYNNLLFHTGIFQVIKQYDHLTPYHCIVQADLQQSVKYYSAFVPQKVFAFSPVVRDAALHCVQACVPEYKLLPVGFKRLHSYPVKVTETGKFSIEAVELLKEGDVYTYNLFIRDEQHQVIEFWEEVTFKVLAPQKKLALPISLAGIIMQRRLDELAGSKGTAEFTTSNHTATPALKRYDGKPCHVDLHLSKSHLQDMTIGVSGTQSTGCDLEKVTHQEDALWCTLLGEERFNLVTYVSATAHERISVSATRIWGIMESIKKADLNLLEAIVLDKAENHFLHYYKCGSSASVSLSFWSIEQAADCVLTLVFVNTKKNMLSEKI